MNPCDSPPPGAQYPPMEREGKNKSLEQILGGSHRVVVLAGPAASGKTTAAVAMYKHFSDKIGRSKCMLLVPNAPAADHLRRKLLAGSPTGVLVAPRITTFSALAGRVLAAGNPPGRRLSPFQRRLLLCRLVRQLLDEDKLSALKAVGEAPGLVVALDRTIAELKRAAVEPASLAPAVRGREQKERDLLTVYDRYQQHLQHEGAYDVEGQMWLARDRLRDACERREALPGLEAISAWAVDGFTDFTPTQLEILDLISRQAERVVITLPVADDGRARMWFWTQRTLEALRKRFGRRMKLLRIEPPHRAGPIQPLWDRLFDLDAPHCPLPAELEAIAAAGTEAEVAAVARRIKRLVLDGAPGGSIAVLARTMEKYRPTIERLFAQHNISISPAPTPLADASVVRFLLAAGNLPPHFAFRDVLRVINSSYFRPQALGEFDRTTAAVAEMIIREGNVLAEPDAYAKAAERMIRLAHGRGRDSDDEDTAAARLQLGPLEVAPEQVESAADMLGRLFALVRSAAGNLLDIAAGLGLHQTVLQHADPQLIAHDLRAMAALQQALGQLQGETPATGDLTEALRTVRCPPAHGESLVDVTDVLDARALRYKHVFLIGLSEGQFPARVVDSSLLGETQRTAWAARGINLDSRGDLAAREMLLFYLAASRCDQRLTTSYLTSDASGQPVGAGSFLLSLLETVGGIEALGAAGQLCEIPLGQFLPDPRRLVRKRDVVTTAAAGLFDTSLGPINEALAWATANAPQKVTRAARGIWTLHRRWLAGPCDAFDGRLSDPTLLAVLQRRYPTEAVFSATGLNTFGQCSWQFFARYVLNLEPLAEPQRRLEPTTRGMFVHNVLFRVMKNLYDGTGGPVHPDRIAQDDLLAALDKSVEAESRALAHQAPYPAIWRIQCSMMHRWMRDYLLALRAAEAQPTECIHFELGFGLGDRPAEMMDPASTPEPVTLATPAGDIRLRGKIDRVDLAELAGRTGLFVVDYKTGALPSQADITAGRNLQLPLYATAAEKILNRPAMGGAFHRIGAGAGKDRLEFPAAAGSRTVKRAGPCGHAWKEVAEQIGQFVQAMRKGRFDLQPTHDCPSYCPYRQICHYAPSRGGLKGDPNSTEGAA